MLDEASEKQLDDELDSLALQEVDGDELYGTFEVVKLDSIQVNRYAIYDVIVQLFSLDLIAHSKKRHPISDKGKYWTLTETGRDQLLRLRAKRKEVDHQPKAQKLAESEPQ